MKHFRQFWLVLAFTVLLAAGPAWSQPADEPARKGSELNDERQMQEQLDLYQSIKRNINLFGAIYREISLRYVDPVNPEAFVRSGINGMLSSLDPYTEYFEHEDTDDLRIISTGQYGGIGIQIGLRGQDRVLTVIAPMEGTPAWRLGIRTGDQIIEIDGEPTAGFSTSDAASRMRGEPGNPVNLKIRRYGVDDPIEYTIVREVIEINDVSYAGMLEPGIGYVRLTRFSRNAGNELHDAIEDIKRQDLEAMILDLRGNPGGLLPEAIEVVENFLQPGELIVTTRGRVENADNEFHARQPSSLPPEIPLVVLVNEGSASASEIVAGAIQDQDRGVIIGQPSFGKGLVQSVIDFRDGTALKITTAMYYTPSGRLIQKIDYFSENEAILSHSDATVSDTLFYTDAGRKVSAHGGIKPDILVEMPEVSEITVELWRKGLFFDFASRYYGKTSDIESWEVTDEVYSEFLAYLDEIGFSFESEVQQRLKDIRSEAGNQGYASEFFDELEKLELLSASQTERLLQTRSEEIKLRIELELASVMTGAAGRVQASVAHDPQIMKAMEVLKTHDLYAQVLSSDGRN